MGGVAGCRGFGMLHWIINGLVACLAFDAFRSII